MTDLQAWRRDLDKVCMVWQPLLAGDLSDHARLLPPWFPLRQRMGKWTLAVLTSVAIRVGQWTAVLLMRCKQKPVRDLWTSILCGYLSFPFFCWKYDVMLGAKAAIL